MLSHSEEPSAEPVSQHSAAECTESPGTSRKDRKRPDHEPPPLVTQGQSCTKEPLPPSQKPLQTCSWQLTQLTLLCPCVFLQCPFDMEHTCLSLQLRPLLVYRAIPVNQGPILVYRLPSTEQPSPSFPAISWQASWERERPLPGVQPSHITREQQ